MNEEEPTPFGYVLNELAVILGDVIRTTFVNPDRDDPEQAS